MSFEEQINPLFQLDEETWLNALPTYQQKRVKQLLESSNSYEDAAKKWLSAIPENTFPFGAEKGQSIFLEKVWNEVEKFLCGDAGYEKERKDLVSATEVVHTTLVSFSLVSYCSDNWSCCKLCDTGCCSDFYDNGKNFA